LLAAIGVVIASTNEGIGSDNPKSRTMYPRDVVQEPEMTDSWTQTLLRSLSMAVIICANLLLVIRLLPEVRVRGEKKLSKAWTLGRSAMYSTASVFLLAGIVYVLVSVLITLDTMFDDSGLPQRSWVTDPDGKSLRPSTYYSMLVADARKVPGLAGTLGICLVFAAVACANTSVHVASRTLWLFGLTAGLAGGPGRPWYVRLIAYFGRSNSLHLPLRAMVATSIFACILVLYLEGGHGPGTSIDAIFDNSKLDFVCTMIIWACFDWVFYGFR
jgi:amino acid transporter